ncbi:hypothetical protein, partial [Prevotella sp.]
ANLLVHAVLHFHFVILHSTILMCLNSLNACKVTIFQTIIQAFLLIFFTDRAKIKEEAPPSLPQPLRREGSAYAHIRG